MATLSECNVCIHCVSCAHAKQLMFFCVLTRVCMISLHICLLQAHWSCGLGSKHRFWCEYPLYIYTHTSKHRHRSTVVTCVVAAWWNGTNLLLPALHLKTCTEGICRFSVSSEKFCRLHLCNADSVGNNVAVTLSSTFLVLATFTVLLDHLWYITIWLAINSNVLV